MPTTPEPPDFDADIDTDPDLDLDVDLDDLDVDFDPVADFDAVARDRAQQHAALQEAVRQGQTAPDIAAALADPQTGDWLLFHGFEVVTDLALLSGPAAGPVDVPAHLTDRELPARVDLSETWYATQLYRKLLLEGSAADQARLLNRDLLRHLWPQRLAPPQILTVWETRFPELRDAV
ncbi:hypothetical protein C3486_34820 [Streptomyces sp. Ru73]|uniref:hypothetical protein n=1 Tax=Streptomyces sp. Ru73 TaxID=2080748 RepID=UPI000CDD943E|nr:hypothetical protein [Streptomyces sp. Ru73]POX36199.1 hypothetical protein C3486_34820 [Streptomyces sp. Ru73]